MDFADTLGFAGPLWLKALVLAGAFWVGRYIAQHYRAFPALGRLGNYVLIVLLAAVVGLVSCQDYGTHAEGQPDGFGGGVPRVVDFVSAEHQRNIYGLEVFVTLVVPALVGVARGTPRPLR